MEVRPSAPTRGSAPKRPCSSRAGSGAGIGRAAGKSGTATGTSSGGGAGAAGVCEAASAAGGGWSEAAGGGAAAWAGTGHGCRGLAARIGQRRFRGAARPDFYERVFDYERVADTLSARIDRFVAATGGEPPRLFVRTVSAADPRAVPDVDMSLTTG